MVTVSTTLNNMASTYVGYGSWVGLATGAPGATATPANEATGGAPAYARKATVWSAGTVGVQNGAAVTLDVAAATYNFMLVASLASGANQYDNCSIPSVVMGAQGQIVVTPTFTMT